MPLVRACSKRSGGIGPSPTDWREAVKHALQTIRMTLVAAAALVLSACASGPPKPDVDYKADYDFSKVRSVAFFDDSGTVEGDNPLQLSDFQKDRINSALVQALEQKGFVLVDDPAAADMLVSWHLVTQFKTDIQTHETGVSMGWYHGYNRYSMYNCWSCMGPRTEVTSRNYTEGTFIVDMIDPRLQRSVWRSVIHSRISGKQSRDQSEYNAAADAIFAAFPPGTSPGDTAP